MNELERILKSGYMIYTEDLYLPPVDENTPEEIIHCEPHANREVRPPGCVEAQSVGIVGGGAMAYNELTPLYYIAGQAVRLVQGHGLLRAPEGRAR